MAQALMIQGTTSDAGKSTLVAGLCRLLARAGVRVAPFKPQNMANNAAVTADGGEIGRAQALQAFAAGLEPRVDFNPVLLKPTTDIGAQVVIHGRAVHTLSARDYHAYKPVALQAVLESWARLQQEFDWILVEGAGSPAEVNLRARDIANMGFAEAVDIPVALVADIDRGGVFAQIVGTLECLSPSERARVRGFVINRFRGDLSLLTPGLRWLEERTGKPVFGVLPHLGNLALEAEDGLAPVERTAGARLRVTAIAWPRVSNHTDLDAWRQHPEVEFHWWHGGHWPGADLVVLPGSKAVQADLAWFESQGGPALLRRHLRYGGKLVGLCGGFQMLGEWLDDPLGLEGAPSGRPGLGLLPLRTRLESQKVLRRCRGRLAAELGGAEAEGYEIHLGVSEGPALARPAVIGEDGVPDGAISEDGQILGTYWHGLFDSAAAFAALSRWAGAALVTEGAAQRREAAIERLAAAIEAHCDWRRMLWLS